MSLKHVGESRNQNGNKYFFPLLLKPWKMIGQWEFGHLLEVMHILEQSWWETQGHTSPSLTEFWRAIKVCICEHMAKYDNTLWGKEGNRAGKLQAYKINSGAWETNETMKDCNSWLYAVSEMQSCQLSVKRKLSVLRI